MTSVAVKEMASRRPFTADTAIRASSEFAATLRKERDIRDATRFTRSHFAWYGELRASMNSWKQDFITAYTGHSPYWLRDKHLMKLKVELGKMFPPFFPK